MYALSSERLIAIRLALEISRSATCVGSACILRRKVPPDAYQALSLKQLALVWPLAGSAVPESAKARSKKNAPSY